MFARFTRSGRDVPNDPAQRAVAINPAKVLSVQPEGRGSVIIFGKGEPVSVVEGFEEVLKRLEAAALKRTNAG